MVEGERFLAALGHTFADHPGLVEDAVGGVPGLLAGLAVVNPVALGVWGAMGFPTTVPAGAASLAWLYPDGRAKVTRASDPTDLTPHGDLEDLMAVLGHRDRAAGQIDVRFVLGPDGNPQSVIVDIPGTKAWNVLGGGHQLQDWITKSPRRRQ